MTDSEITTTILREIRDEIIATRVELKAEAKATRVELGDLIAETNARLDVTNERIAVLETVVRVVGSHVKVKQDPAIQDRQLRVSELEKKVSS